MIYIIRAVSRNGVIGRNGKIPWRIPGEQKRFRQLTTGNAVVMGRRTYEEIGRPLPGRLNIVVSKTCEFNGDNLITVQDLPAAIAAAGEKDVYISGGSRLYKEALPLAEKILLTEIDMETEGDTFFPDFDKSLYTREVEGVYGEEIEYSYVTYTKK